MKVCNVISSHLQESLYRVIVGVCAIKFSIAILLENNHLTRITLHIEQKVMPWHIVGGQRKVVTALLVRECVWAVRTMGVQVKLVLFVTHCHQGAWGRDGATNV